MSDPPRDPPADDARWRLIEELFHAASELPPVERTSFLDARCGGDDDLRREVESLLAHSATGTSRIQGAVAAAAEASQDLRDLPAGTRLGPYRLERVIGRGGLSTVYLAERADGHYRMRVAIKVVSRGMESGLVLRRLEQERQILAHLDHPNVARLLDGGTTESGLPFFVMEYIEGEDLEAYCTRHQLGLRERLNLFRQVCAAVDYAHRNLVIHRDLKPANILVGGDGVPKLLDFGIAKLLDRGLPGADAGLTVTGLHLLTPLYASPEQIRGDALTTATDVYSLGVILYRLLTGQHPYELSAKSPAELERVITGTLPERPSLRTDAADAAFGSAEKLKRQLAGDLDTIVLKALRKEPERRYATPGQLAEDLSRHLRGRPVRARPDSIPYRARKFLGRHRLGVAALAGVLALMAFYSVQLVRQRDRAKLEADKAASISEMMTGLFELADPSKSGAGDVTARELLRQGAERIRDELQNQPEVRATMMGVIATSYHSLGHSAEARGLLEEALPLRRQLHGERHEAVAETLNQLGEVLFDLGEYSEAHQAVRQAYVLREELLGEQHPDTLTSLNNLGALLYAQGDLEGAATLMTRNLELQRQVLGPDHPDLGTSLNNLASLHDLQGDFAAAEELYLQALEIKRRTHGERHPYAASVLNNLAGVYESQGKIDLARESYEEALDVNRTLVGDAYLEVPFGLHRLGRLSARQGRFDEAEEQLAEAARLLGSGGTEDVWLARVRLDLAGALAGQRRCEDAEAARSAARPILAPDDRWAEAEARSHLGDCWRRRGQVGKAEPLLRQAAADLEADLGAEHSRTVAARERLSALDGSQ